MSEENPMTDTTITNPPADIPAGILDRATVAIMNDHGCSRARAAEHARDWMPILWPLLAGERDSLTRRLAARFEAIEELRTLLHESEERERRNAAVIRAAIAWHTALEDDKEHAIRQSGTALFNAVDDLLAARHEMAHAPQAGVTFDDAREEAAEMIAQGEVGEV